MGGNRDGNFGETTLLLRRCVDGSTQARDDLHRHIWNRVRAMARKELAKFGTLSRRIEADDVQQEVQAKLEGVLQTKPPEASPALWKLISMIVPQILTDHYRKMMCRPLAFENQLQQAAGGTTGFAVLDCPTASDDPAKLAEWTEFHQRAMALSEPSGLVFRLRWYDVMPVNEIAKLLEVDVKSVFNYYRRALDELAPCAPLT